MRQRIMIVDDNSQRLISLRKVLEIDEYEVKISSDFYTIVESMSENAPDLVVINMLMSSVNGFRAIKLIRTQSNVPVIAIFGIKEWESIDKAFTYGADDYLIQPFNNRVFLARVAAKLKRIRVPVS